MAVRTGAAPELDPLARLFRRFDELEARFERLVAEKARPKYTVARNCEQLHGGRKFRALDEWAQRQGLMRHTIGGGSKGRGTPAYLTEDIDALVLSTGRRDEPANQNDLDGDYAKFARGGRCRR
jgi:hypothetical protein